MPSLFVRRLTVLDFAYMHAQRGLVGESWLVDVELGGALDDKAMILDFADVKREVKRCVDEEFDHRLLVPAGYGGLKISRQDRRTDLRFPLRDGSFIEHSSPEQAIALIPTDQIDIASVARAIEQSLRDRLPDRVESIRIDLRPEQHDQPYFHYTHGLKRHAGNCQRIAHGHRSRLEIEIDGQRDSGLEQAWTTRWRDIYIATAEDIQEQTDIGGQSYLTIGYHSGQGDFRLILPAALCYRVETDSTIENMADHLHHKLAAALPDAQIRATVFEGIDKGASSLG